MKEQKEQTQEVWTFDPLTGKPIRIQVPVQKEQKKKKKRKEEK